MLIHKIHHIGLSGIVFTKCGEVRSSAENINITDSDKKVTCEECLEKMDNQSIQEDG